MLPHYCSAEKLLLASRPLLPAVGGTPLEPTEPCCYCCYQLILYIKGQAHSLPFYLFPNENWVHQEKDGPASPRWSPHPPQSLPRIPSGPPQPKSRCPGNMLQRLQAERKGASCNGLTTGLPCCRVGTQHKQAGLRTLQENDLSSSTTY